MIIYCTKTFDSFVDFCKVIDNFEPQTIPFGTIDIVGGIIRDSSLIPRYLIKFKFNCPVINAVHCENYLQGYLFNLLGEFY